eukprot:4182972-Pleurochrysis_carterae.AAC.2
MPLSHFGALRCPPLAARRLAVFPLCSPAPCAVPPLTTRRLALSPSRTPRGAAPSLSADVQLLVPTSAGCHAHHSRHGHVVKGGAP